MTINDLFGKYCTSWLEVKFTKPKYTLIGEHWISVDKDTEPDVIEAYKMAAATFSYYYHYATCIELFESLIGAFDEDHLQRLRIEKVPDDLYFCKSGEILRVYSNYSLELPEILNVVMIESSSCYQCIFVVSYD